MIFVDGCLMPVAERNRTAFTEYARWAVPIFQEHGADRIVDAFGDDVPAGEVTDFRRAVAAEDGETVGFGWVEYPDRATRDAAMKGVMEDPRMNEGGEAPFDGKRMVFGGFEAVVDEGSDSRAGYVDGFVAAVPKANKDAFIRHASEAAPVFLREGALRVVECWEADVPEGKVTDFFRAVNAQADEAVIFSWIEWPDRATRDAAMKAIEPEMEAAMADNPMPFDGKRMIYGGFEIVSDAKGRG